MNMRMGMMLRTFGPVSSPELVASCAEMAEKLGVDDLWVTDHIAIPPDEAEGSGGRYLDSLATLSFLAGITSRIGLGTCVLIIPYRAPLVTAKWIATIQELSAGRLTVGAAVGWMEAEFRAAQVDITRRGKITDDTLAFWHECFSQDEVILNGQKFIFKPRPQRPPILIGGNAPHALNRAVKFGEGWMPTEGDPDKLKDPVSELSRQMQAAEKPGPDVIPLTALPLEDEKSAIDRLKALSEIGVTGINHAGKYNNLEEFTTIAEQLLETREKAGIS